MLAWCGGVVSLPAGLDAEDVPGEDRFTTVLKVPSGFLAGSPRDEVFARLGNLGMVIGEPDSVVHDKIGRRIVVRASREKTATIEALLAWGSDSGGFSEVGEAYLASEAEGEFGVGSAVVDKLPIFGPIGSLGAAVRRAFPERQPSAPLVSMEFTDVRLDEALARVAAVGSGPSANSADADGAVPVFLDMPEMVAKRPVTLRVVDLTALEAIALVAETGGCRAYLVGSRSPASVLVSCIDLKIGKPPNEGAVRRRSTTRNQPENLWLDAFWHLFSADSRDRLTSRGHANEALHRYARIAEEHPAFHPELVWARLRDVAARQ